MIFICTSLSLALQRALVYGRRRFKVRGRGSDKMNSALTAVDVQTINQRAATGLGC
jgi:hypothetical protein